MHSADHILRSSWCMHLTSSPEAWRWVQAQNGSVGCKVWRRRFYWPRGRFDNQYSFRAGSSVEWWSRAFFVIFNTIECGLRILTETSPFVIDLESSFSIKRVATAIVARWIFLCYRLPCFGSRWSRSASAPYLNIRRGSWMFRFYEKSTPCSFSWLGR